MSDEIRRSILYFIERVLVRGAHYRFLVVVAIIGIVSVVGGLCLVVAGGVSESPGEAIWWAFLRLTDPGYLGDDEGVWRRIVSTTLTVLGYVIFLGAMVAILTQWLNDTLNRLEKGLTPIRLSGHIAILGWTNRTQTICRELVMAEGRLSRWLQRSGARRLRIAILAPKVGAERDMELRNTLGPAYRRQQFVLRSGSCLRANDLRRVDLGHAACIVLPGLESTSQNIHSHDATVIKTLRAIAAEHRSTESLPTCVCEVFDPRKVPIAMLAYGGPLEVLPSDVIIGRLLGDSLRQPGCSTVLDELLTHGTGGTLYVRTWHAAACSVADVIAGAPAAIFLGLTTDTEFRIAPAHDTIVEPDNGLVFIAPSYGDTQHRHEPTLSAALITDLELDPRIGGGTVLMLGWSRRMPDLLLQLDAREDEVWTIDVLSAVDLERRKADLEEHNVQLVRTQLTHQVGDLTVPETLVAAEPSSYDRVFLVASDWPPTNEASDARTISTYIALQAIFGELQSPPPVLVELSDEENLDLLDGGETEVLVSPQILSRLLAQVVLRRQLRLVIDEVFGAGPTQLRFVTARRSGTSSFNELAATLRTQAKIAIGVRRGGPGGELILGPDELLMVEFARGDAIIVLDASGKASATKAV